MRNTTWIILLIAIVIGIGAYILLEKKNEEMRRDLEPDISPRQAPVSDPGVKRLQEWINSQLPDDYPKLVEDGIMGPKTRAAIDFLAENDPENDTVQKIVEVASTINPVVAVAKTEYDLAKKVWKWLFK